MQFSFSPPRATAITFFRLIRRPWRRRTAVTLGAPWASRDPAWIRRFSPASSSSASRRTATASRPARYEEEAERPTFSTRHSSDTLYPPRSPSPAFSASMNA